MDTKTFNTALERITADGLIVISAGKLIRNIEVLLKNLNYSLMVITVKG